MRTGSTAAGLVALCILPFLSGAPAAATPRSGVTAETLFHTSFPVGLGSTDLDGTDFTVRRIEIAPG